MIKIELTFASARAAAAALEAVAALGEKLGGAAFNLQTAVGAVAGNAEQSKPDPKPEKAKPDPKPGKAEAKATQQASGPGPSTDSSTTSGEPSGDVDYATLQAAVFRLANKDRAAVKVLMDQFCGEGGTFKVYAGKTGAERAVALAAIEAKLAELEAA